MSTVTLLEPTTPSRGLAVGDDELYEVIDSQRVGHPPMSIFAVYVASQLMRHLGNYGDAKNLGRAESEGLFHLPAPISRDRRPDVAFVSYQRWAKDRPIPLIDNAWDVVPNLTTEVVSPTDKAEELEAKVGEYFRAGVELVWVVYPLQRVIYVYQSPTRISVLTESDALDGGIVVSGFHLPLAELFGPHAANGVVA